MTSPIVIDLETIPGEHALSMPCPEDWLSRGIKDNFRPETIERYRADNLASWPTEVVKRASLDWRLGRIVALGVGHGDQVSILDGPEESILLNFWGFLSQTRGQVVGFNIRNFDWPWIVGRSAMHGILASRKLSASRYSLTGDLLDWADVLCNFGSFTMAGWTLEQYAMTFDLNHRPVGKGSEVYGWFQEGNLTAIRQHLEADIRTTMDLDRVCRPAFLGEVPRLPGRVGSNDDEQDGA